MSKELGQRTDAELESLFGNMYSGWDRGVNVTQERFGNGETRFTETPMTVLELAARFVAAEIGVNIYEIAGRAAFAPIIVFSQIQARIGPVFEQQATTIEAQAAEIERLRAAINGVVNFQSGMTRSQVRESCAEILDNKTVGLNNQSPFAEAMLGYKSRAEQAESALAELTPLRDMLILCGELGGMQPGETTADYLRRLIDGLIIGRRALESITEHGSDSREG